MIEIRAIKIDVVTRSVTEITMEPTLAEFYRILQVDDINAGPYLPNGDVVWVDGTGVIQPRFDGWFSITGGNQPYAGHGLVVGLEDSHEVSCKSTLQEITEAVTFHSTREAYEIILARDAFETALALGHLSDKETAENFVGLYMYMGTTPEGTLQFKHINTRRYNNLNPVLRPHTDDEK